MLRFARHLTRHAAYRGLADPSLWKRRGYFHAFVEGPEGLILVRAIPRTPRHRDVDRFRAEVEKVRAGRPLDRAVILYREDPRSDLSESLYYDVMWRPIVAGEDVCSIQLVAESLDGTYDFAPIMSHETPSAPSLGSMMPFGASP